MNQRQHVPERKSAFVGSSYRTLCGLRISKATWLIRSDLATVRDFEEEAKRRDGCRNCLRAIEASHLDPGDKLASKDGDQ